MQGPPLVLASASPRRRQLLEQVGLSFEVLPSHVEETYNGEPPEEFARRISARKAAGVSAKRHEAAVVAADTVVVLQGRVLGKPGGPEEARAMLAELSGREHRVITAVTVRWGQRAVTGSRETRVRFRKLRPEEIDRYVATGEPLDKAGAYGIQDRGILLVDSLKGCYTNVVGLPLGLLRELFLDLGLELL
ncbi:MAG: Maf family protein [Nitrospinota bacterium]